MKWHPIHHYSQSQGGQQCKSTVLFCNSCLFVFGNCVLSYLLKRKIYISKIPKDGTSNLAKVNGASGLEDLSESSKKDSIRGDCEGEMKFGVHQFLVGSLYIFIQIP